MGRMALMLFLAAALLGVACEDDFSPKSDFNKQLAVFAVMDPSQPMQVVRLAWSYDAELGLTTTPLTDAEVHEADVRVIRGGEIFIFQDTLVSSPDGKSVRSWFNRDLRPLPEKDYRLQVTIPGHPVITSTVTLPSRLYVRADLVRPDTGVDAIHVYHGVTSFVRQPAAFYFRLWVEITKWNYGDTLIERREIPLRHIATSGTWVYPSPGRADELSYSAGMLREIAEGMMQPGDSIVARRVITQVYGLESNFYSYFKIVRGFDDPLSMRLDAPDVSFIEGGLGVFGGMVSDSIVYNYYRFIRD
ncbi:MAG: DUF4249 family protein [Bacteroidetes bacterium]|nr:DUF4249 family protein [Bacteroidota bacterium]